MISNIEPRKVAAPKYFRKTPSKPGNWLIILSIVVAVLGIIGLISAGSSTNDFDLYSTNCCSGSILIVAAVFFMMHLSSRSNYNRRYAQAEPKPTDEQMSQWLKDDIEQIKSQSLSRLDLQRGEIITDQKDPLIIVGPGISPEAQIGGDGVLRFSVYDALLIYLTDHQVSTYKCTVSMADGVPLNVSTQEYHYADIVSVSTQTVSGKEYVVTLNNQKKSLDSYQEFALSVASGEQIKITVSLPQLEQTIVGGQVAETNAEQAIRIIRAVLREKKSEGHR